VFGILQKKLWSHFNFHSDWDCLTTVLCEGLFSHNTVSLVENGTLALKWDVFIFAIPTGLSPTLITSPAPIGLEPAYVNQLIPHPTHQP
jgi:hypothetical protein